jgi:hypothetical protein
MSTHSRRAILAGAILAFPTTALPAPSMCHEPDAELMALGAQFRALLPAEKAARDELARLAALVEERLAAYRPSLSSSREEYDAYHAERRRLGTETGRDRAYEAWTAQMPRLDELAMAIMDAEATTLQALALQAEVCAWQAVSYMVGGPLDWSQAQVYRLVTSVFRAAGEPLPAFLQEAVAEADA